MLLCATHRDTRAITYPHPQPRVSHYLPPKSVEKFELRWVRWGVEGGYVVLQSLSDQLPTRIGPVRVHSQMGAAGNTGTFARNLRMELRRIPVEPSSHSGTFKGSSKGSSEGSCRNLHSPSNSPPLHAACCCSTRSQMCCPNGRRQWSPRRFCLKALHTLCLWRCPSWTRGRPPLRCNPMCATLLALLVFYAPRCYAVRQTTRYSRAVSAVVVACGSAVDSRFSPSCLVGGKGVQRPPKL